VSGKTAVSLINVNSTDKDALSHEMAHHFMGDTYGLEARIVGKDPIGLIKGIDNAAEDITNDYGRWVMNHTAPRNGGPGPTIWNDQAKQFQKFIQPTTN
jgi:hypothetical protein